MALVIADSDRRWRLLPEWAGLAAGAMALLVAHAAQAAGMVPCALCYVERWPYRVALVLAVAGLAWGARRGAVRAGLRVALVLAFAVAAGIAAVHVGVEHGWWKSPLPECAAPVLRTGSIRDMLASMPAHPSKPCDDPNYLIPGLALSMAEMNLLFALAAAGFVAMSAWQRRGER